MKIKRIFMLRSRWNYWNRLGMALTAYLSNGKLWIGGMIAAVAVVIVINQATHTATVTQTGNGDPVVVDLTIGPILTPGETGPGSWTATSQPAAIGNYAAAGYTQSENAIARWDVVPYQAFDGNFNVGVVAFHSSGIDHVAFSVNGGAWVDVTAATANPQTANTSGIGNANAAGVVEYWATLRASDFEDGQIEVRAIAYPNIGTPRVIQGAAWTYGGADNGQVSLMLFANADATITTADRYVSTTGDDSANGLTAETAKRTITDAVHSAGTTIVNVYLMGGSYNPFGRLNREYYVSPTTWINISPAPGVTAWTAILAAVDDGGFTQSQNSFQGTPFLHLRNLKITTSLPQASVANCKLWFDACEMTVNDRTSATQIAYNTQWQGGIWCTDCYWHDIGNLCVGIGRQLARNCTTTQIGEHQYNHFAAVLNSGGTYNYQDGTAFHADIAYYDDGALSNVIWQDFSSTEGNGGQGLAIGERYGSVYQDFAFVRCNFGTVGTYNLQAMGGWTNLYIKDCAFTDSLSGSILRDATHPVSGAVIDFTAVDSFFDDTTFSPALIGSGGVVIR